MIPRNTPTIVNSAIIGDSYWIKYKYHGDKEALSQCENICQFIMTGINRSGYKSDGSFCFSYTPIDNFQVHNANLFGAEFLIRIGTETGRDDWVKTGLSAASFSLSEIRADGTLNYWSNEQAQGLQQDTYNSGFEIRALDSIAGVTGDRKFREAANRYFATWLKDYFSKQGVPCFLRGQYDVIEVHSCAESLLCAARIFDGGNFSQELFLKHVRQVIDTAVKSLWVEDGTDKGYFAMRNGTHFGVNWKIKIPMIRWGQAWMFNALSTVLSCVRS
ncbi:MAG: hypothetical protein JRF72_06375 [Deltaproteobacteria bacterium]|nr:hypothetical protein [Deltaproteobacteria bacterium]